MNYRNSFAVQNLFVHLVDRRLQLGDGLEGHEEEKEGDGDEENISVDPVHLLLHARLVRLYVQRPSLLISKDFRKMKPTDVRTKKLAESVISNKASLKLEDLISGKTKKKLHFALKTMKNIHNYIKYLGKAI